MRNLFFFFALMLMATVAHAADPTTSTLDAPFVDKFITLSIGPDSNGSGKTIVKYSLDTSTDDSPLPSNGLLFRSNGVVSIRLQSLNPLAQTWVVKDTATPDLSYAAIKGFLDDLKTLQAALPQQPAPPPASAAPAPTSGPPAGGAAPPPPSPCTELDRLIRAAYAELKKEELKPDDLRTIVSGASGFAGVTDASSKLSQKQTDIEADNKKARAGLDEIRVKFGSLDQSALLTCSPVTGQILVDYVQVHGTAEMIIAAKQALYKQLGDLISTLQPYLRRSVWRGPTFSDYEIRTVNPTFAEQRAVDVTVKERTIQLVDGSIVVKTDDANVITSTFNVSKSSFFVAERAAAVIYNRLTYPQYGTETNASGQTVVKRNTDHEPIGGALMLNLVMRLGRSNSVVHPLLQLGVSSAKEFPGFLAGIGLRFVDPFNFSVSVGGMITRYKDLDGELKVGDPVSGTADINKHLVYKTSPVAIYGAMQLKF